MIVGSEPRARLSFAAINCWARIRLASASLRPIGVRNTVKSSLCVYVWLPRTSVPTGHADGFCRQKPFPTGHVLAGIVVVVEELVVLVLVVVGWVVVLDEDVLEVVGRVVVVDEDVLEVVGRVVEV